MYFKQLYRLVCRLTSPLCYNFLGLVHLDSHITKDERIVETEFTRVIIKFKLNLLEIKKIIMK